MDWVGAIDNNRNVKRGQTAKSVTLAETSHTTQPHDQLHDNPDDYHDDHNHRKLSGRINAMKCWNERQQQHDNMAQVGSTLIRDAHPGSSCHGRLKPRQLTNCHIGLPPSSAGASVTCTSSWNGSSSKDPLNWSNSFGLLAESVRASFPPHERQSCRAEGGEVMPPIEGALMAKLISAETPHDRRRSWGSLQGSRDPPALHRGNRVMKHTR